MVTKPSLAQLRRDCHSWHEGRCLDTRPCICRLIHNKGHAGALAEVEKLKDKRKVKPQTKS